MLKRKYTASIIVSVAAVVLVFYAVTNSLKLEVDVQRQMVDVSNGELLLPIINSSYDEILEIIKTNPKSVNEQYNDLRTPIFVALNAGRTEVLSLLIEKGANINYKIPSGEMKGLTPLNYAVALGDFQAVTILVNSGADLNSSFQNLTPLERANKKGLAEIVNFIERGKNEKGTTP